MPAPAPKNGLGTAALVLGILGVLFSFIPIVGVIAWPLVVLGLIVCIAYAVVFTSAVANLPATPGPVATAPAAGGGDAATTGKPGATLAAGDMQVTATALRSTTQQFFVPMKCAEVTYRNTGSVQAPFNMFDWTLQNPGGAITGPTIGCDNTLSPGELAPGGTTSGQVCFDAKNSRAGTYTLTYAGGLLGGDKVSWTT